MVRRAPRWFEKSFTPPLHLIICLITFGLVISSWRPAFASVTVSTLDSSASGIVGQWSSIKLQANGNPIISYYDNGNAALKLAVCGNPTCTAGNTFTTIATSGNGQAASLALSSAGLPVISYYSSTLQAVRVIICATIDCASGGTSSMIAVVGNAGGFPTALRLTSDDRPVVSYTSMVLHAEGPRLAICADSNCTSVTIRTLDTRTVGTRTALALTQIYKPLPLVVVQGKGSTVKSG